MDKDVGGVPKPAYHLVCSSMIVGEDRRHVQYAAICLLFVEIAGVLGIQLAFLYWQLHPCSNTRPCGEAPARASLEQRIATKLSAGWANVIHPTICVSLDLVLSLFLPLLRFFPSAPHCWRQIIASWSIRH